VKPEGLGRLLVVRDNARKPTTPGEVDMTDPVDALSAQRRPPGFLTRDQIVPALQVLAPTIDVLRGRIMLVGTASCAVSGIDLPVGDVDFLARDRQAVDELGAAAVRGGFETLFAPGWLPWTAESGQYFARYSLADVWLEFSTVEVDGHPRETAAWKQARWVEIDGIRVALEATESRLATELARNRPERWVPIARHLAQHGYDEAVLSSAATGFSAFKPILDLLASDS
jgi:hypothetical protein